MAPADRLAGWREIAIIEHMFGTEIEELTTMSALELDAVIAEAELAKRAAEARMAAAVAVVSARGCFRDQGYRSIRAFLKGMLNCSGAQANRIRKRADLLNHHGSIGDALLSGHVGVDQVDRLAKAASHPRAGDQFADFAPLLLEHAEQLEYRAFDNVVEHFINQADPDGAFDAQEFHEDQRTASVRDDHGAITVFASGGCPQAAAEMTAAFELAVQAEFEADCATRRQEHGDDALAHPLQRTVEQRKFDALHQIFLAWVTVPTDGATPVPLVNILFDHVSAGQALAAHGLADSPNIFGLPVDAFEAAAADPSKRRCETTTGTSIHPDVALRAMIAGRVRRAVVDADSVVIDLGRTQRLFTGKARDAAQLLVTTCTHRGCDVPATLCDVDHRRPWASNGGPTDQANAMPLCGPHDRWKHTTKIRSRRASSGQLFLIKPDGTTILPVGAREPDWAELSPESLQSETRQPHATQSEPSSEFATESSQFGRSTRALPEPESLDNDTRDVTITVRPHPDAPHRYWFDGHDLQRTG